MKTTSIAHAKNNLSSLIQEVERSEPIHLTRHGKPVAVIISEADYQNLAPKTGKLFKAICNWRRRLPAEFGELISDDEQKQWRDRAPGRSFSWDD
ncbi:MAG: type II toxin-antitoxin system Phd/YefM family antitoxin [Gammaproteobacteria bacterium]